MKALIMVDVQNDFCPGGALPVPNGDEVVNAINSILDLFRLKVVTKDWHPGNHSSFKEMGGMWPPHCVQYSHGAELHDGLGIDTVNVFYKGMDKDREDYSPFFEGNSLHEYLQNRGVATLYICGLATDYCVKATVLDARKLGYDVFVVTDACRGVDVTEGDSKRAFRAMEEAGAKLISSEAVSAS